MRRIVYALTQVKVWTYFTSHERRKSKSSGEANQAVHALNGHRLPRLGTDNALVTGMLVALCIWTGISVACVLSLGFAAACSQPQLSQCQELTVDTKELEAPPVDLQVARVRA